MPADSLEGAPMKQRNRVSAEGKMLGQFSAAAAARGNDALRRAGLLPHRMPGARDEMCASCACRAGTIPNGCMQTQLDFLKTVIEGERFLCHAPKDGRICAGWMGARAAHVAHPFPDTLVALAKGWEYSPADDDDAELVP